MPETAAFDLASDWRHGGFGIYVHWPFCQSKCPYCDFNSHVTASVDQRRWADAFEREIIRIGAETEGRVVGSVFFGGGTPSLMEPFVVERVLQTVRATWPTANDVEITLEANPGSIEAGRFAAYRDAGVNRVSMGMQAMNDADLKALGRLHTAEEALRAFDIARSVFDRVSFDLIYARQGQGIAEWRAELDRALSLDLDHLSLYQLTIEEGTAFGARHAAGLLRGLPDEDLAADLWDVTQERTAKAGLDAYEVSNHARQGAASYHNMLYWRGGDYAGIGPGAHGRLTLNGVRYATEAVVAPGGWLAAEQAGKTERRDALDIHERFQELLLMGLRLSEGVEYQRIRQMAGDALDHKIGKLVERRLIGLSDKRVSVTAMGRPVLNAVLRELLDD